MSTLTVSVITPDQMIFEGEVNQVRAFGFKGYFTILPHHAPLVVSLEASELQIEDANEKMIYVAIDSGIIEVANNHINILSQVATIAKEPNVAFANMEQAEKMRRKKNIKSRQQAIKSEMELYRLLQQAHEVR